MEQMVAYPSLSAHLLLRSLVRAEEDVYRVRRRRRLLVSAMALASVVCFVAARAGVHWLRWSSLLFAVLAIASLGIWRIERRLTRRRDAIVEQLPIEYQTLVRGHE
jgi:Flp pilus assembly protein TadB